jgi:glycosyltransferase involved in cell wall biosynthesis
MMNRSKQRRIGFVSTRLAGTDGVTLETYKWVHTLTRLGHECFYFVGESEFPAERSYVIAEAHFSHPEIRDLNVDLFDDYKRSSETSGRIQALRFHLKNHLYKFVEKFDIELLIIENALSIPMNIPLGLAITEFGAETNLPIIAHHHDFGWERSRFKVSAASDYQLGAFPPILPSFFHVVINSYASRQLALRTGASSVLIPNVMDFDNPPPEPDGYAENLRSDLGIDPEEYLLLQPTRIVPRKRIELAMELARRLQLKCALLISHSSGDEGSDYEIFLREHAELSKVKVIFAAERFNHRRGRTPDGNKIYSLVDAYKQADLVTYPSTVEGFGNAFLETLYYKKPIVMSTYEIYNTDIKPKGFRVISFGDFITQDTVEKSRQLLSDPAMVKEIVEHNYKLGRQYYSYHVLQRRLQALLDEALGFAEEYQ